jgi:ribose transport system permease protein
MTVVKKKALGFGASFDLGGIALSTLALFVVISLTSSGFVSAYNITANLQLLSIFVVIGLAQMIVLSLGQFNLAIGSMGCLSGIAMGFLMQDLALSPWMAMLACLAVGSLLGFVQGEITARSGITPFIITLAFLSVYKGVAYVISKGEPFQDLPESFMRLGNVGLGVLPLIFMIAIVGCLLVYFVMRYLPIGKKLLACGANPRASVYTGIRLERTVVIGHTMSGFLCGLAAILQIIRFGSAQLSVGTDWMMSSFMAPVLGGTLLSGGKISVGGTLIGALLVVLIKNALVLWGASTYNSDIFLGILLVIAYEVDGLRRHLSARNGLGADTAARTAERDE